MNLTKPLINTLKAFVLPKINEASNSITALQEEEQKIYSDKFVFVVDGGIIIGMCIDKTGNIKQVPVNCQTGKNTISVTELLTGIINLT